MRLSLSASILFYDPARVEFDYLLAGVFLLKVIHDLF